MMFANEALIHFFIGVGICLITALLFFYYGKRRRIFRFGGDSPLSLGTKKRWIAWYLCMAAFEFASSFHWGVGPRMYVELAFSIYQAAFATLGLFLVDRLAMLIIEPEEHWMPKTKEGPGIVAVQPSKQVETLAPAPAVVELSPPTLAPDRAKRSWLRNKLAGLKKNAGEGAEGAVNTVKTLPAMVSQNMTNYRNRAEEAKKIQEEEERKKIEERLKKLRDSLKGY